MTFFSKPMRSLLPLALLTGLAATAPGGGAMAAAPVDDAKCVQAYLGNTAFRPGAATGKLDKKTIAAAAALSEQFGLGDALPPLSGETVSAWCAFTTSAKGVEVAAIGRLRIYPSELKPKEPEADPGVPKQYAFNFSKVKLGHELDGRACNFSLSRILVNEKQTPDLIAIGKISVLDGRISFTKGQWLVGGTATPDSFVTANIGITDKGLLLGKMQVFHMFTDPGEPPHEPVLVAIKSKVAVPENAGGQAWTFDLDSDTRGVLELGDCH